MSEAIKKIMSKNPDRMSKAEREQILQELRRSRNNIFYIEERKKSRKLAIANHPERPKIVSSIPAPVEARGGLRKFDHFYPFEDMKPGDSFWVSSETECTAGAVTKFAKKSGWRFVTRGQTEDGRKNADVSGKRKGIRGTRVWRIS